MGILRRIVGGRFDRGSNLRTIKCGDCKGLISLTRNPLRTYISKSFPNTITFHIKKALHIDCLHLLLASIYFIEVN
ncbi:hypothetical protein SO802_032920 [Lithocarpus litseifolius]|uniref:Uncharacterized protein n=1 Tax=Lithocarpus litseifolius TaxID=425828 RepID=A0AAW2BEV4_9ROSI